MIRQSQKQEGQFASFEDTAAHLPEPFVAEAPGRWHGNRTGPIGDQTEKFHPQAVRRLYLAVVNRAILDVLKNGQESREAKRWLLSRNFDSLQAAVDKKGERTGFPTTYMAFGSNRVDGTYSGFLDRCSSGFCEGPTSLLTRGSGFPNRRRPEWLRRIKSQRDQLSSA
jgi:hypothetical protein